MPRMKTWSMAALMSVLAIGRAWAQPPAADEARLKAFLDTTIYKQMVNKALASVPPTVFRRCPALLAASSKVTVLRPVAFGPDGHPAAGAWRQAFPVSGCGNDTTINLFFAATGTQTMNALVGLPGSTNADPVLQRDARHFATTAALAAAKGCTAFVVTNTRFEAFGVPSRGIPDPGPERRLRPWFETWTLVGCGRTFAVPMDFLPDATGTQIIQPGGVKERHG